VNHPVACPPLQSAGLTIPVFCRRSSRARRLQLRVSPDGVWLVLPRRGGTAAAAGFLRRHEAWAVRHWRRLAAVHATLPRLAPGCLIPFRGTRIRLASTVSGTAGVPWLESEVLHWYGDANDLEASLRRWYLQQAAALASRLVADLAPRFGAAPCHVRLRDLRSRWGSCSATGTISLNWRLVLAPDAMFAYVIAHELCHLRQRRHGPVFQAMVKTLAPDADHCRKWLRSNQEWMMAFLQPPTTALPLPSANIIPSSPVATEYAP